MNTYTVKTIRPDGTADTAVYTHEDERGLRAELAKRGLIVLHVEQSRGHARVRSISRKERLLFFESLAVLLSSNILLADAVDFLGKEFSGALRTVTVRISESLRNGSTFSDALRNTIPEITQLETGIIRVGETVGSLAQVLPHLVEHLRREKAMRDKLLSAIAYPLFVLSVLLVGVVAFSVLFVPFLQNSIGNVSETAAARIDATVNGFAFFVGLIAAASAGAAAAAGAYRQSRKSGSPFAARLEALIGTVPVLNRFLFDNQLIRMNYTLSLLVEHRVPMEKALEICAGTMSRARFVDGLSTAARKLHEGKPVSAAFGETRVFPDRMVNWIRITEKTGRAGESFGYLAKYYEERQAQFLARVFAVFEPAVIVLIGIVLLFVVMGTIVPVFEAMGRI